MGNITPIFKQREKGRAIELKADEPRAWEDYEIMEQNLLKEMLRHLQGEEMIWNNQHGFKKLTLCLTRLVTLLQWSDRANEVNYLAFFKAFDTVPYNIFISKLERYKFKGQIFQWVKNWLDRYSQRVVVSGSLSMWRLVASPKGACVETSAFQHL